MGIIAEAHLKWEADTTAAQAQILALRAIIKSIGDSSGAPLSKASNDLRRVGRDGEKAGNLIQRAFRDIPKSLDKFGKGLNGPFGILKPLGLAFQLAGKVGKAFQDLGGWMSDLGGDGEKAASSLAGMGATMGPLVAAAGPFVAIIIALGAALAVLPALIGAATFVLYALLQALTTGVAVIAAFVAPLTVVTGLLGGLGAAFAYVAAQSFKNKATLQDQHDALLALHVAQQTYNEDLAKYGSSATQTEKALLALHAAQDKYEKAQMGVSLGALDLEGKFKSLVHTLAKDFQPQILQLAGAASKALTFLGNIAKLPLAEAFHQLATRGVAMLSKFMYGVGHALAEPFRLAIKTAFGGTSWMHDAMNNWWNSLTNYLFGYTKTKKVKLGFHTLITKTQVDGALQPILDWFNRQHFTAQGAKWANQIWNGIKSSGAWASFKAFIEQVASDAGAKAGAAFRNAFLGELGSLYSSIQNLISPGSGLVNGLLGGSDGSNAPSGGGGGRASHGGSVGPHSVTSRPSVVSTRGSVLVGHVYVDSRDLARHMARQTARRG